MSSRLAQQLSLIPWPRRIHGREGSYRRRADRRWSVASGTSAELAEVAREAAAEQDEALTTDPARPGDLVVRQVPLEGSAEAYHLSFEAGVLVLEARQPVGLFRATRTAAQLGDECPGLRIEDAPAFDWRGLLLDCSRHFVPVDRVLRTIDQIADHKMNRFHWHLTDDHGWRLQVEALPRLAEVAAWRRGPDGAPVGGCYSPDDVAAVLAHARRRHVEVIPEIELPGHSLAALAAHPELSCTGGPFEVGTEWGIFDDVYCAGSDDTFRFLETVFEQVLAQFPSEFIHLGGDECPKARWRSCPRCQERIRAEGLRDEDHLQSWFVGRMGRWLSERGRRFVGWDEILEGGLPAGAVVQSWQGVDGAIAAARAGHDTIVSPVTHCYLDYNLAHLDLETAYAYRPVPDELNASQRRHVLGGECNLWTERAPPERIEERLHPRMLATAERLWSGTNVPYPEFRSRVGRRQEALESAGVKFGPLDDPGHSREDRFDWTLA